MASESEPVYRDIAGLMGEATDDAWEAMAESYAMLGFVLAAVLQKVGRVRLLADWFELAQGFQVALLPLRDGTTRVEAVRKGEVRSDSREMAERMRAKWERQYVRRTDG